ncbi:hypothetical protein BRC93_08965 [Halobacteriales archaeon QS_5_70_15]|nr:MAG: hypothetical protein BRC93_08965 [Halobacteriales archaeon QS_5_70_15]
MASASSTPNTTARTPTVPVPALPGISVPRTPALIAVLNLALLAFVAVPDGGPVAAVRAVFGVAYLSLVPGWLVVGLLDPDGEFGAVERSLYAVGLSLLSLMFVGLALNTALPFVGVDAPLRPVPLALGLGGFTTVLAAVHERRGTDPLSSLPRRPRGVREWRVVALFSLLPAVALVGGYANRVFLTNLPTMVFLLLVATLPFLLVAGAIPERLHPFALYATALGMLVFGSLHTPFLTGRDPNWEYYFANLVVESGRWDPGISFKADVMLGISLVRPTYAMLSGLPLENVYKHTSPLLFAAVPVGLYHLTRVRPWGRPRLAFLSAFLLVSFWSFYTKLADTYRQQLAMTFLLLFVIAWYRTRGTGRTARLGSVLLVPFGFGLTVSHYGTAFVFMALSGVVVAVGGVATVVNGRLDWFEDAPRKLPLTALAAFLVLGMTWYMYVGNGILFNQLSRIGGKILVDLLGLQTSVSATGGSGARWVTRDLYSVSYEVFRWLNYVTVGFVTAEFLAMLSGDLRDRTFARLEYLLLAGGSGLLLVTAVLFPSANPIDLARLYPIALFWIAPLCVGGGLLVLCGLARLLGRPEGAGAEDRRYAALGVFFAVFLLYSTGFVPAVTGEFQYNEGLVIESELGDLSAVADSTNGVPSAGDVAAARFLADHREVTYSVITDFSGVFVWSYAEVPRQDRWPPVESGTTTGLVGREPNDLPPDSYVLFRTVNTERGILIANVGSAKYSGERNYAPAEPYLHGTGSRKHLVYSNGGRVYV